MFNFGLQISFGTCSLFGPFFLNFQSDRHFEFSFYDHIYSCVIFIAFHRGPFCGESATLSKPGAPVLLQFCNNRQLKSGCYDHRPLVNTGFVVSLSPFSKILFLLHSDSNIL